MSFKKFGYSSLCLIIVSAASTSLMSQVGIAATFQSPSYKPSPQIFCGCPQPPVWEEKTKSTYRPPIYCPDSSPFARTIKRTCPDFYRTFQGSTTNPKSSIIAYDPDAKEAAKKASEAAREAREAERTRGHSLEGVRKEIEESVLRDLGKGREPGADTIIRGVFNHCTSCHKEWP